MKEKNIETKGNYKGFTNEGIGNLLKLEASGPLDFSKNDSNKDAHIYQMQKISSKISTNMNQLSSKQREIEALKEMAV
jgi:hypothetical protein